MVFVARKNRGNLNAGFAPDKDRSYTHSKKEIKFDKFPVYNRDGDVISHNLRVELPSGETRVFKYNDKIKTIENFHTQKQMSEAAIKNYLVARAEKEDGKKYVASGKFAKKAELNKIVKDQQKSKIVDKNIHIYKNENKLISSKRKIDIDFIYSYVRVKIKVHFDGWYKISFGSSDYYYKSSKIDPILPSSKNKKLIQDQIPDTKLKELLHQAINRALFISGGYDVKYELMEWWYNYKQRKGDEFR